jgi:hypothetical protein
VRCRVDYIVAHFFELGVNRLRLAGCVGVSKPNRSNDPFPTERGERFANVC